MGQWRVMSQPLSLPVLHSRVRSSRGCGVAEQADINSSRTKLQPSNANGIGVSAPDYQSGSRRSRTVAERTQKQWDVSPSASTRSAISWHFSRLGCK